MVSYCSNYAKSKSDEIPKSVDFVVEARKFHDHPAWRQALQKHLRHQTAPEYGHPQQPFHRIPINVHRRDYQLQRRPNCVPGSCLGNNVTGALEQCILPAPQTRQSTCATSASNAIALNANNRPPDGCLAPTPNHTPFYASQARVI